MIWPTFLALMFNFTYGFLLPLIPRFGVESAGVAFSMFALVKLALTVPSGHLTDRLGAWRATGFALVVQALALGSIAFIPSQAWIGRGLQGFALALGQVAVISLCRTSSTNLVEFERLVARVIGIGSLGYVAGPALGFALAKASPQNAVFGAAVFTTLIAGIHFLVGAVKKPARESESAPSHATAPVSWQVALTFMIALGCTKALIVGMEPVFAWWASDVFEFPPLVAGLTFVVLSVAFAVATWKPHLRTALACASGLVLIEISLRGMTNLWWLGIGAMGYWAGVSVTTSVAKLGWNKPETIGRTNSRWLLITDFPMSVMPVVAWSFREPSDVHFRGPIEAVLLLTACVCLSRGVRAAAAQTGTRSS
ncbi:MAG: MFS transporter [Bdellovibrionota bacterium]